MSQFPDSVDGYRISVPHDPDLVRAWAEGGEDAVRAALQVRCECGHPRHEHMGATGALASFGGSACNGCWTCRTFRPVVA
jgi:hypothetical protein